MTKYVISKPNYALVRPDDEQYDRNLYHCLMYIGENIDNKKRKDAVLKWCSDKKEIEMDKDVLAEMPELYHESTGKYCFIAVNGGTLPKDMEYKIEKSIRAQMALYLDIKAKGYSDDEATKEDRKNVVGIQEYLREKMTSVCHEFDVWVDMFVDDPKTNDLSKKDIKSVFSASDLKPGHYRFVSLFYKNTINELKEVVTGEDPDLLEGYSFLTKPNIRKMLSFYEDVVSIAEHMKNTGAVRKARAPKAINTNKASAKMVYLKEDELLKIKSVHPSKIFGAKEVWVYNAKTKKLGVYVANDASGLSVKGTSIKGFSDSSTEKTIKKSTKIDLLAFSALNRTAKKAKYREINTIEVKLKGRVNEHCLILAVDK